METRGRVKTKLQGLNAIMWEYRWQRLQLLFHLEKGHVPHRQDAITGQINCKCEYVLKAGTFFAEV